MYWNHRLINHKAKDIYENFCENDYVKIINSYYAQYKIEMKKKKEVSFYKDTKNQEWSWWQSTLSSLVAPLISSATRN